MVHLESFALATELAFPAVSSQDFEAELRVALVLETLSRSFGQVSAHGVFTSA
jgi:hypothetical protein